MKANKKRIKRKMVNLTTTPSTFKANLYVNEMIRPFPSIFPHKYNHRMHVMPHTTYYPSEWIHSSLPRFRNGIHAIYYLNIKNVSQVSYLKPPFARCQWLQIKTNDNPCTCTHILEMHVQYLLRIWTHSSASSS